MIAISSWDGNPPDKPALLQFDLDFLALASRLNAFEGLEVRPLAHLHGVGSLGKHLGLKALALGSQSGYSDDSRRCNIAARGSDTG